MRSLKKLKVTVAIAVMVFFLAVVINACQKGFHDQTSSSFDAKAVKEWYYGSFKKSPEFKNSMESGRKLPDWKNGVYRKVGAMEIVEFPLNKHHLRIPVEKSDKLTEQEYQQIVKGSLSRIVFVKMPDGNVKVREVLYIPTKEYLEANHFDISGVHLGIDNSSSFDGKIVVKQWNGLVVSTKILQKGKVIKTEKKVPGTRTQGRSSSENCQYIQICEYERYCYDVYEGDQWIGEECGPWTATGFCWTEEICPEDGTCDFSLSESCECQLYGLGCGEENPNDPPTDCSAAESEAEAWVLDQWNSYLEKKTDPGTFEAAIPQGTNIYSHVHPWNVVWGAKVVWKVVANVDINCYMQNQSTGNISLTMQHLSSAYSGSNNMVITTWTQTSATTPVISNNNTPHPYGKYFVSGNLHHRMKADIEIEYKGCKVTLSPGFEDDDPVTNSFTFVYL